MAFENIDCINPSKPSAAATPRCGLLVTPRRLGLRDGGQTRYLRFAIGADLAKKISLTQAEHKLRVLFGTGSDAGKVQVSVDNSTGKFTAKRDKRGSYAFTMNAATAEGLFALEFPPLRIDRCEAVRPVNGQPPHFVFTASAEMLDVHE